MAPTTMTVMLFRDGSRPEEISTPTASPSISDSSSLDMSADTSAPSHGLLVARQSGSDPNGYNDNQDTGNGGNMSVYYFVFFALLICIAVLCIYFVWRRRRNALMIRPSPHGQAYHRDVREWDTMRHRRHYWSTTSRNEQASREEGLNENGEAPPPYMPKDDEETDSTGLHANRQRTQGEGTPVPGEPSIPMQTLSRAQAGLKPPGYQQSVQPVGNEASGSRLP
jgi:hypothetical protein